MVEESIGSSDAARPTASSKLTMVACYVVLRSPILHKFRTTKNCMPLSDKRVYQCTSPSRRYEKIESQKRSQARGRRAEADGTVNATAQCSLWASVPRRPRRRRPPQTMEAVRGAVSTRRSGRGPPAAAPPCHSRDFASASAASPLRRRRSTPRWSLILVESKYHLNRCSLSNSIHYL